MELLATGNLITTIFYLAFVVSVLILYPALLQCSFELSDTAKATNAVIYVR